MCFLKMNVCFVFFKVNLLITWSLIIIKLFCINLVWHVKIKISQFSGCSILNGQEYSLIVVLILGHSIMVFHENIWWSHSSIFLTLKYIRKQGTYLIKKLYNCFNSHLYYWLLHETWDQASSKQNQFLCGVHESLLMKIWTMQ